MLWQTPSQLETLLCELVSWKSRTGSKGEINFPYLLKDKLMELEYFSTNPSHIQFHHAEKERNAVTALYKHKEANQTIVLISHFDTVHTKDFGALEKYALQPDELLQQLKKVIHQLPESARADVTSDDYLFGRGTMDMKMGLVLHMHLLDIASSENWPINLLLVTVPDEEATSSGMRAVVKDLVKLREKHDLTCSLFLNSEPSFTQHPHDENYYIYSGSIGKIMPSALFYGRETHAGEPLSGINAHYMASFMTNQMEYAPDFTEKFHDEKTPLPICLTTFDLKKEYSTQTSNHVAALYNVFLMKQDAEKVMNTFKKIANKSMKACQQQYEEICHQEKVEPIRKIKTLEYRELLNYATEKIGSKVMEDIKKQISNKKHYDEREMSVDICDELMAQCPELAPAVVLFFAPPYNPPVNSSEDSLVQMKIAEIQDILQQHFQTEAKQIHYFNGISDLSYVNYDYNDDGWKSFKDNAPVWGEVYSIPFKDMQALQAPVMNIGPFGKDAHKLTERLHKKSAFEQTPYVLRKIIESLCS